MSKQRILFLGSKPVGHFALSYLINQSDNLNCEVVGILTNDNLRFDSKLSIIALAEASNIPIYQNLDDIISLENIDFLISVQYHLILKKWHLDVAKKLALNLHVAPLPEYRGCNQFSFAIANGDTEFGTTFHKMEVGIDSGPIIAERRFAIPEGAYIKELFELAYSESKLLFADQIDKILTGNYEMTSQKEYFDKRKQGLHYRKDIETLKQINIPQEYILKIRATAMEGFEMPYTLDGDKKIYHIPEEILSKIQNK